MRVIELWRFPVKSLQGERVESVEITGQGLAGDRRYALFDLESGFGLTARRRPELLFAAARTRSDGSVEVSTLGDRRGVAGQDGPGNVLRVEGIGLGRSRRSVRKRRGPDVAAADRGGRTGPVGAGALDGQT